MGADAGYASLRLATDGRVATLRLSRPDSLNAFDPAMGGELKDALTRLAADDEIRAVVLTGEGRAFSSGADLKNPSGHTLPSGAADLGWSLRELYNPIVLTLRSMPQPVVAAVNGVAAGVGCSIALACDHVLAAESASFLLAFVNAALVPDGGASVLVAARAGFGRASEMALGGRKVPAATAESWGLVNGVVPADELPDAAADVAARLAAGPPEALASIKSLLNAQLFPGLEAQLAREAEAQTARSGAAEVTEAIAAFREKRAPQY